MKILKYKKMSKGRYKLTLDKNELILYEDVIIKNGLLLKKDITLETLKRILEENKYYEIYNLSLSYIEIRMRTELELKEYLMKKLFPESLIDEVIKKLKNEGYINEEKYIEAYINDKINLSSKGPFKIKRELLDLGLNEYLIDSYLNKLEDNIWKEKLNKIINKKVDLMKNKSEYMIKNKLKLELFNLGYDNALIEELLNNIKKDDNLSLEKEYIKALNKYQKKYEGTSLKNMIKNYLYKRGYNLSDIMNIIKENLE